MASIPVGSRRGFIAGLGMASVAGLARATEESKPGLSQSDYLLPAGTIHLAIYADVSISGLRLTYLLEALGALRGYPREIVLDNVLRTEASLFADDEHPERDVE
jgi:hypothetical protein